MRHNRNAVATSSPGLPPWLPWGKGCLSGFNRNAVAPALWNKSQDSGFLTKFLNHKQSRRANEFLLRLCHAAFLRCNGATALRLNYSNDFSQGSRGGNPGLEVTTALRLKTCLFLRKPNKSIIALIDRELQRARNPK